MAKVIKTAVIAAVTAAATVLILGPAGLGIAFGNASAAAGVITFGNLTMVGAYALAAQYAAVAFVGTAIAGGIGMLTSRGIGSVGQNFGTKLTGKGAQVPRQIVYGQCKVGGTIVKMSTSGTDNNKLHLAIVLAGHEIESLEEIYFYDEDLGTTSSTISGETVFKVTNGRFVNDDNENALDSSGTLVQFTFHDGSQTTVDGLASANLSARYPSSAKFQGMAYIYMEIIYDPEKMAQIPPMSFVVKGKKVFDPRTSTTAFSSNPALIVRDYLMDTTYGLRATSSEINDATSAGGFSAAATACDVDVDLNQSGSQQEKRFTANGFINAAGAGDGVLEGLLSSCAGKVTYTNGKFNMFVGTAQTPTLTITDDDLLQPAQLSTKTGNGDLFNGIKALYVDSSDKYNTAEAPTLIDSTFLSEDTPTGESSANYTKILETQLPFTTTHTMAQRLAKIQLRRQREGAVLSVLTSLEFMRLQPSDVVKVNNTRLSFSEKTFEVLGIQMEFGEADGVLFAATRLTLQEVSAATFNYVFSEYSTPQTIATRPEGGNLSVQSPTAGTITQRNRLEGATTKIDLVVPWTNHLDSAIQGTEVQYKESGESTYSTATIAARGQTQGVITNVNVGKAYEVRIRHFSYDNVFSSFVSYGAFTVAQPNTIDAPTNLTVSTDKPFIIQISYTNPTVENFRSVELYFGTTATFTPASSNLLGTYYGEPSKTKIVNVGRANGLDYNQDYYFKIRSVNQYGSVSAFVTSGAAQVKRGTTVDLESLSANLITSDTISTNRLDVASIITTGSLLTDTATISNNIRIGSGQSVFSADSDGIYLGDTSFANAEFRVSPAGAVRIQGGSLQGTPSASGLSAIPSNIFTRSSNKNIPTGTESGAFIDLATGAFVFGNASTFLSFANNTDITPNAFELDVKGVLSPTVLDLSAVTDVTVMPSTIKAQGYVPASIPPTALSDEVWNQIDGLIGQSGTGFYVSATGRYLGEAQKVIALSSTPNHRTGDITVQVIIADSFSADVNFASGSDPLKLNITLQYKLASESDYSNAVTISTTSGGAAGAAQKPATPKQVLSGTVYSINENIVVTLTSGSGQDIADNTDLDFRVLLERVGSQSVFAPVASGGANDTVGTLVELQVSEGAAGIVATGGNAETLDNIDSTGFLRLGSSSATVNNNAFGNQTFTGDVTVTGTLNLQGSIDQYNVTDLEVVDKTISLNSGNTQSLSDGAGIKIDRGSASDAYILWDESNDEFDFSNGINLNGKSLTQVQEIVGVSATGWLEFNEDDNSVWPTDSDNLTVLGSSTHMVFAGDSTANGTGGIFYFGYGQAKDGGGTFTETARLDRDGDLNIAGQLQHNSNLTLNAVGSINLDADNTGNVFLKDNNVSYGRLHKSGDHFVIKNVINDGDIIFQGQDSTGTELTPVTFDMSLGGRALFSSGTAGTSPNILTIRTAAEAGTAQGDVYAGLEFAVQGAENSTGNVSGGIVSAIKAIDYRANTTTFEDAGIGFYTLGANDAAATFRGGFTNLGGLFVSVDGNVDRITGAGDIYADSNIESGNNLTFNNQLKRGATVIMSTAGTLQNINTISVPDSDFIVQDSTNSNENPPVETNIIWRDHSASRLYLGTSLDVVEFRGDVNFQSGHTLSHDGNVILNASRNLLNIASVSAVSFLSAAGSAASPAYQVGDTDSGFFDSGANEIGVSLGGVLQYEFKQAELNLDDNNLVTTGYVKTGTGTATSPALQVGDDNSGFFDSGANEVGVTLDGALEYEFTPTQFDMASNNLVTSGDVMVGKTSLGIATTGIEARSNGLLAASRSSAVVANFNRQVNDGSIVDLRQDNALVGSIGTVSNFLTIGKDNAGIIFNSTSSAIYPWNLSTNTGSNGLIDLGLDTRQWKDFRLAGKVIIGGTTVIDASRNLTNIGSISATGPVTIALNANRQLKIDFDTEGDSRTSLRSIEGSASNLRPIQIEGQEIVLSTAAFNQTASVERVRVSDTGGVVFAGGFATGSGVTIGGGLTSGAITVNSQDSTNEGGEIRLKGAGTNLDLFIDNFAGSLRVFDSASTPLVRLRLDNSGNATIAGRVVASNGTTLKAAYGFASSATTGISYSSTNNRVNILSGGAVRAYVQTGSSTVDTMVVDGSLNVNGAISTTGNVTLDSANPILDLVADANADAMIRLRETGTGIVGTELVYDGGSNEFLLNIGNNPAETALSINRDTKATQFSGSVGINCSPSAPLEVSATGMTGVDIAHFSNSNNVAKAKFSLTSNGSGKLDLIEGNNATTISLDSTNGSLTATGAATIGSNLTVSNGELSVTRTGDNFPTIKFARTGGTTKTNQEWLFNIGSTGNLNLRSATGSTYYPIIVTNSGDVNLANNTSGGAPVVNIDQSLSRTTFTGGIRVNHSENNGILVTASDTNVDQGFNAMKIDYNLSGAQTATADRTHAALFIDVDSSATGGDTSDEHRVYGIYNDTRVTGDSDLVFATFSQARTDNFATGLGIQITHLRGLFGQSVAHHNAGQVNNNVGVYGYGLNQTDGTGQVTHTYGGFLHAYAGSSSSQTSDSYSACFAFMQVSSAQTSNIEQINGLRAEVQLDNDTATDHDVTINNAYVVRATFDENDVDNTYTVTNGYLFFGDYQGNTPTNAFGVYIADDVESRFLGRVRAKEFDVNGTVVIDSSRNLTNITSIKASGSNTTPLKVFSGGTQTNNTTTIKMGDFTGSGAFEVARASIIAQRSGSGFGGILRFTTGESSAGTLTSRLEIADNGDISFFEDTGTTAKLFFDASAESLILGANYSSSDKLEIRASSGQDSGIRFANDASTDFRIFNNGSNALQFNRGTSTLVMLIDSNGDVIVGGNSSGANDAVSISNTGYIQAIINDDTAGYFNRRTSDGEIIRLQKNGATVGSIGTTVSGLVVGNGDTALFFDAAEDSVKPRNSTGAARDGAIDLGKSSHRFKDLHMSGSAFIGTTRLNAGSESAPSHSFFSDFDTGMFRATTNQLGFTTGGSERGRFDASGNLLIGTTSDNVANQTGTTQGVRIAGAQNIQVASTGTAAYFNRLNTDGTIVEFRRAGTAVGDIESATNTNTDISIGSDNVRLLFFTGGNAIVPRAASNASADATIDLGNSGNRFKDLHMSGSAFIGATRLGAGSASAPSHSFFADFDTGMYRATTNQLGFATGGSEQVRISSGGLDLSGSSASLTIRRGNVSTGTTVKQIIFGYAGTTQFAQNIRTRHNSGAGAGNAIDFYLWDQANDVSTDHGSLRAVKIETGKGLDLVLPNGGYQINGTTVITSARNLTNIGTGTFSGTITTTGGNIALRRDTNGDSQTLRDIEFLNSFATGTDDRAAIIRAQTQGGGSGSRGGKLVFYTRQSNSAGFNSITLDALGVLNVGNLNSSGAIQMGGTAVIDSNRNLTNIGSISASTLTTSGDITVSGNQVFTNSVNARVKFAVWSNTTYGIGMTNGVSFGGIGAGGSDYAMTFQMNTTADRGFLWLDSDDTLAQGAMALTTQGLLTVAGATRIGFGKSDTTTPASSTAMLNVNGAARLDGFVKIGNAGSASDPTIQSLIDPNTGIFFGGADILGFSAGGSEQGRFDADGLHVGTATSADINLGATDTDARLIIKKADNNVPDHIQIFCGGTQTGQIGSQDTTWLRINQNVAKNIYTPRYIRADSGFFVDNTSTGLDGSGRLRAFAGSTSSVGIGFANDIDTGFYRPAANTIDVVTAGDAHARFDSTGNLIVEGNVTAFGSVSDIRLKENVERITEPVEKVKQLDGVTFNYRKTGVRSTGLIAQQLLEVLPEVVYQESDMQSGEKHYAVRYGPVVGLLVEAIKEQQQQIDSLQDIIKEMTNGNNEHD